MKRETTPEASAAARAMNARRMIVMTPEARIAVARRGGLGKGIAYRRRRREARASRSQAAKPGQS
jgi:hypothetical protein